MKLVRFIFCVSCFVTVCNTSADYVPSHGNTTDRIFEPQINKTLEEIKQMLKDGDVEMGIPPMNPLEIDAINIPINIDELVDADITASNIVIKGIPDFLATNLQFNILNMKLEFTILMPSLILNGNYNLNGNILQFVPVFGNGSLGAEINDLSFAGHIKVSLGASRVSLKDLQLTTSLESIKFSLTGLMDNDVFTESLVNTLNEHVGPAINNLKDEISRIVSPILMELINNLLNK